MSAVGRLLVSIGIFLNASHLANAANLKQLFWASPLVDCLHNQNDTLELAKQQRVIHQSPVARACPPQHVGGWCSAPWLACLTPVSPPPPHEAALTLKRQQLRADSHDDNNRRIIKEGEQRPSTVRPRMATILGEANHATEGRGHQSRWLPASLPRPSPARMQPVAHRKCFSPCRKRCGSAGWLGGDGSGPAVVLWAVGALRLPVWRRGLRGAGRLPPPSRSLLLRWRKVRGCWCRGRSRCGGAQLDGALVQRRRGGLRAAGVASGQFARPVEGEEPWSRRGMRANGCSNHRGCLRELRVKTGSRNDK